MRRGSGEQVLMGFHGSVHVRRDEHVRLVSGKPQLELNLVRDRKGDKKGF